MCIRFGSDDGRDFLSTRDPVAQESMPGTPRRERARDDDWRGKLQEFLAGFYGKRGSDR
jgi:hypothetical protein